MEIYLHNETWRVCDVDPIKLIGITRRMSSSYSCAQWFSPSFKTTLILKNLKLMIQKALLDKHLCRKGLFKWWKTHGNNVRLRTSLRERKTKCLQTKKEGKQKKQLFWEFKVCYFSDRPFDVANCHQIITYKLKIDSLSPKTESGYLQRKWVFATKYVFANKWKKVK